MPADIQHFVQLLKTQENAATARPLIIELQVPERIFVSGDHHYDGNALVKDMELGDDPVEMGLDPEERLYWRETWVGVAWFLTHEGYEDHLRLNKHNYRKGYRKWIHHAFRNPEMTQVYEWLAELAALKSQAKT